MKKDREYIFNDKKECQELTIIPISGSYFIVQLGLISLLSDNGYKPRILIGNSGGALVSYIWLCANFTSSGIFRVIEDLNSDLYTSSWLSIIGLQDYLPSGCIGVFKGSLYNNGTGSEELLRKYLSKTSIKSVEVLVGTYNSNTCGYEVFSNLSYSESNVKCDSQLSYVPFKMNYLDGDFEKIAKSTYASTSIPTIVKGVEIDGDTHFDSGIYYASSILPISSYISNCIKILYISSFNMETNRPTPIDRSNILSLAYDSISECNFSRCVLDRIYAIRLIMKCSNVHFNEYNDIKEALELYRSCKNAVMELYPKKDYIVNITNFNNENLKSIVKQVKYNYGIRMWWSE